MIIGITASNLKCIKCKDCFNKIADEQIDKLKNENELLKIKLNNLHSNAKIIERLLVDQSEVLKYSGCANCLLTAKMLDAILKIMKESEIIGDEDVK